jgi:hypothetical protein
MAEFPKIPHTLARLKPFFAIKMAAYEINYEDPLNPHKNASLSNISYMGEVQDIDIKEDRASELWRSSGGDPTSNKNWVGTEVVPGIPTYDVTLKKVLLYAKQINNAWTPDSFSTQALNENTLYNQGFDVLAQYKPVVIGVDLFSPTDTGDTVKLPTVSMIFYSCWFESFPLKFDVDATGKDILCVQEVKCKAAYIDVSANTTTTSTTPTTPTK